MVTCVQKDQGFSVTLRSQPEQVGPGGEFSLTLTVRNLSGKPREFVIPTAQEYEFRAFVRGGNEVWRYGRGAVFAQVVTTVGFQPGDDQVFKLGWSTQGVPPGEYTVDGYFMGLPEVRPAVPVAITPQQASL